MAFCLIIALLMPGFLRWISGLLQLAKQTGEWEANLHEILKGVAIENTLPTPETEDQSIPALRGSQASRHDEQDQAAANPPIGSAAAKIRPRRAA
mgnify:CR=1 FL=1